MFCSVKCLSRVGVGRSQGRQVRAAQRGRLGDDADVAVDREVVEAGVVAGFISGEEVPATDTQGVVQHRHDISKVERHQRLAVAGTRGTSTCSAVATCISRIENRDAVVVASVDVLCLSAVDGDRVKCHVSQCDVEASSNRDRNVGFP